MRVSLLAYSTVPTPTRRSDSRVEPICYERWRCDINWDRVKTGLIADLLTFQLIESAREFGIRGEHWRSCTKRA